MLIYSIILYLLSISVALRRDVSIHYSRSTLLILIGCIYISILNVNMTLLGRGLAFFGGLFHLTPLTQIFKTFVYIISVIILLLTSPITRTLLNNGITRRTITKPLQ